MKVGEERMRRKGKVVEDREEVLRVGLKLCKQKKKEEEEVER